MFLFWGGRGGGGREEARRQNFCNNSQIREALKLKVNITTRAYVTDIEGVSTGGEGVGAEVRAGIFFVSESGVSKKSWHHFAFDFLVVKKAV